jgi:hypothetical protein
MKSDLSGIILIGVIFVVFMLAGCVASIPR